MADKSCDCFSENESSFYDSLFNVIIRGGIRGGAIAFITYTTSYLIDKTLQLSGKIEELFSRLEECEKNHELKK